MKTIIIIIIIVSVLYCIGIGQDQPAPKAPARNRSEENRSQLSAWMQIVDDWQQIAGDANDTDLINELHTLYDDMDAANRYGHTTTEFNIFRSKMKSCYKMMSMLTNPDQR